MRLAIVTSVLVLASVAAAELLTNDFTAFFPQYAPGFTHLLHTQCADHYAAYEASAAADIDELPHEKVDAVSAGFDLDRPIDELVDCLLDATPELIKSKMASAQVLLGLTPSVLALVGPGVMHTAVVASVARRPLLALLLAAGSPIVGVALDEGGASSLREMLSARGQRRVGGEFGGQLVRVGMGMLVYVVAMASIANVAEVAHRLGTRVIFTFAPGDGWVVLLWAFIGLAIRILGAIAVYLRIIFLPPPPEDEEAMTGSWIFLGSMLSRQRSRKRRVRILGPSATSTTLTWLTALTTAAHVFNGTLLFSSVVFISVNDSVFVVLRLMASVLACRLVLGYEVARLRCRVEVVSDNTGS